VGRHRRTPGSFENSSRASVATTHKLPPRRPADPLPRVVLQRSGANRKVAVIVGPLSDRLARSLSRPITLATPWDRISGVEHPCSAGFEEQLLLDPALDRYQASGSCATRDTSRGNDCASWVIRRRRVTSARKSMLRRSPARDVQSAGNATSMRPVFRTLLRPTGILRPALRNPGPPGLLSTLGGRAFVYENDPSPLTRRDLDLFDYATAARIRRVPWHLSLAQLPATTPSPQRGPRKKLKRVRAAGLRTARLP